MRLQQVLLNLLSNGVKFTETGSVDMRAECLEDGPDGIVLMVAVTDTGIGMTPAAQDRLFQPFVQADASTTRRFGGSGLGLSIARRIVERMGGTIDVVSQEGHGSRFWFTATFAQPIPDTHPHDEAEDVALPPAATALAGPPPHLLLVEDNDVNRLLVRRMLQKVGCLVDTACNGVEAVSSVLASQYDLVLMDVRMPEMDGLDATRRIREHEATGSTRTTILALTANATSESLEETSAAGMDGFLSKPVRMDALQAAVALWCRPRA